MSKARLLTWILAVILPVLAWGQTTGKISGVVKDAKTGDPLIGANVIVTDSQLGAATGADGSFVILNVPAGDHTLQVNYMGYKQVTLTGVEVLMGRTARVEILMEEDVLQLGETVTVTAERPIVEADKTGSSIHLTSEEISNLPVEGLRNVLELTAGISRNADGTISIRGGSGYEINYQVNGIKSMTTNTGATAFGGMNDKADNSWKYDVNPLAVAQMEVISGGFNAEHGNAQSGVIKVVTKEGGETFSGGFRMEYRPPGQYHWGDYLYSKNQIEWEKWGDYEAWLDNSKWLRDTSFTLNGIPYNLYEAQNGDYILKDFNVDDSAAINNYNLWVKNHTPSGADVTLVDGYEMVPVTVNGETLYRKDFTLNSRENPTNIMGVYDYRKIPATRYMFSFGGPLGNDPQKMNFFFAGELKSKPTRLPTREKTQDMQNLSFMVSWKPSTNHNFKFTNMYQFYRSGMGSGSDDVRWAGLWGWYGARRKYTLIYDPLREETVLAQNVDYKYLFSSRTFLQASVTHQSEVLFALQLPVPGIEKDAQRVAQGRQETRFLEERGPWFENYRDYYTWSSLYNQASITHYYEGNVSFTSQVNATNLIKIGLEAWLMDQDYNASSSLTVSSYIWRTGFSTNYKAKTRYFAAYAQDKIEFAGMVGNIGLRLDAYNFGGKVPINKYELFYPAENEGFTSIGIPAWEDSKTFVTLSPRIGISFPIADKTAFRVQYGHFRSMPLIHRALDNQTNHGWGSYGNPNLEPQLSVNYEIGIQQNLWGTHQLDIVTYYNDLKNQTYAIHRETTAGSIWKTDEYYGTYTTYTNNSYGSSQGVEITFRNRVASRWRYNLTYTLSQTKIGYHGPYLDLRDMTEDQKQTYTYSASDFISGEDRTHRFNLSLSYGIPENAGPEVLGLYPMERMTFGLIYRVSSGAAYFWSPSYQTERNVQNNRRYPLESVTDLQIEKNLTLGGIDFMVSIKIRNLFNNKQLTPIDNYLELSEWVTKGVTYMDGEPDPTRNYHIFNYWQAYRNVPREIYLTFGFDF
jgi:outer membrane receptor protein involved in Fe transport